MNKPYGIILANFVLLTAACRTAFPEDVPTVAVSSTLCRTQAVRETLTAYGTVQADLDQIVNVSLSHAGLINRVLVRAGQRVAKGAVLFELRTSPEAQMQYLQAEASVNYARQELARRRRLLSEQLATQADIDAAQKNLLDGEAALDALVKRKQGVSQDVVRAPMDGIILRMDIAPGQQAQSGSGAILMASEAHLVVNLGVEPEDLNGIQPGAPVRLRSVFVPTYQVTSSVREVHAMIDPGTHLVDVLVPIPGNQTAPLVLGSQMIGTIELQKHEALLVPRSSVLDDEQDSYLFVVENGTAHRRSVLRGIAQGSDIEVSGEISAGDRVVVTGNYELSDGMTVREIGK